MIDIITGDSSSCSCGTGVAHIENGWEGTAT